jgi:hypothetical protein
MKKLTVAQLRTWQKKSRTSHDIVYGIRTVAEPVALIDAASSRMQLALSSFPRDVTVS